MSEETALSVGEYLQKEKEQKEKDEHLLVSNLYDQIRGIGRPTSYQPEFIKVLLLHMGVKGKSYKSLAFVLGIASFKTLYNWETQHPEWKMAKQIAESGRLNYIEDLLQSLADGTFKGNAAAAIFYAKNAAPEEFQDNRNLNISGSGAIYIIDTGIPAKQLPDVVVQKAIEAEFIEVVKEDEEEEEIEADEDLL